MGSRGFEREAEAGRVYVAVKADANWIGEAKGSGAQWRYGTRLLDVLDNESRKKGQGSDQRLCNKHRHYLLPTTVVLSSTFISAMFKYETNFHKECTVSTDFASHAIPMVERKSLKK
jgi:hypothetical protein